MNQPKKLRMSFRFNILMLLLMLCLFVVSSLFSYQRHQTLITKVVRNDARIVAGEVLEAMGEWEASQRQIHGKDETTPVFHRPLELQKLINRITAPDRYLVKVLSFNPSSNAFSPSGSETAQMNLLLSSKTGESHRYIEKDGENMLRYLRAIKAEDKCLGCHGQFKSAPAFVRTLFPVGSRIYGRANGEVMGAVAVTVPMKEFLEEAWWNLYDGLFIKLSLFLLVVLFLGSIIRRRIIDPVATLTETVAGMTKSGNFIPVKPAGADADIRALVQAYNELMAELQQRTEQYRESEQRYRTVVEMSDAAIVTFLVEGKIILSNSKAERLFGLSKDDLIGMDFFSLLETGAAVRERLPACIEGKPARSVRTSERVKDSTGGFSEVEMLISALDCQNTMYAAILWE